MSLGDLRYQLTDEMATVALGGRLAQQLRSGGVVFLLGTLGAGKTTLTRGLLNSLGHVGAVKSPTYTLVEPYELAGIKVFHFDLYRLGNAEELEYMGIRDYFLEQNLCIVEWPSRGAGILPQPDVSIELSVSGTGRLAVVQASTPRGEKIMQSLIIQP